MHEPPPYEPEVIRAIGRLVKPGMTVLDVGANVGAITGVLAEMVGPGGKVHAFEPTQFNLVRLREKFGADPRVEIHPEAVSDVDCESVPFFVDEHLEDGVLTGVYSSLYDLPDPENRRMRRVVVRAVTLDGFCGESVRPGFIKVDVEGAEPRVIAGGRRVIAACRPAIVLEFWTWTWASGYREAFGWLESTGYRMFDLGWRRVVTLSDFDGRPPEGTRYLLAQPRAQG